MTDLSVLDVETTGLFPKTDRVLEVAVVRLNSDGTQTRVFESLLNPGRDVGPTDIHGITARDVREAPSFEDVAGTVFELLADAVIVGHNVRFDLGFLAAEARRAGWTLPPAAWLDTMSLSDLAGLSDQGRSLRACCQAAGLSPLASHRALDDARATAELFRHCRRAAPEHVEPKLRGLAGAPLDLWPRPSQRLSPVCRAAAAELAEKRLSYLGRIVDRLPGELSYQEGDGVTAYYALLDRVLEDRLVTPSESEALLALALEWGLTAAEVRRAHSTYLDALICAALRDGEISAAESEDLKQVALLLGIDGAALGRRAQAALQVVRAEPRPVQAADANLVGQRVCFTGALRSTLQGVPISRERAEELAESRGLIVSKGVTRMTDLLVVADPETLSGKAQKARRYGTRIMAEAVFWPLVGVRVD